MMITMIGTTTITDEKHRDNDDCRILPGLYDVEMSLLKLQSFFVLGIMAATFLGIGGCVAHVDRDYHHDGYYDDHHDWHGGFYDEDHVYHEDPRDWHR